MLIYCKAFLHLDPYHSCASVCLHLSSGLAFIPKEEPDPLGSMHIYINTAYIGSLWRPKKENHLQIVNVSSQDGTVRDGYFSEHYSISLFVFLGQLFY